MPSKDQVLFRDELNRRIAEENAQRASEQMNQQAHLQSLRDSQLTQAQYEQMQLQLNAQQQRDAQAQAAAQYQLMLQGNLRAQASQQDWLQGLQTQAAGFEQTMARDQQSAGFRRQEMEQGANLEARLNEIKLTQAEQVRLNRLREATSEVDAQVRSGMLSAEEGAMYRTELLTGINPLARREAEANRLNTMARTQSIYQAAEQQDILFRQRQERLSANPESLIRVFRDPYGNEATFQMNVDTGRWEPLDFTATQRAAAMDTVRMAGAVQGIQQSSQMFPGQLQAQQAGIDNTRAQTTATLGSNQRANEMLQPNIRHMNAQTDSIIAATGRADLLAPLQRDQIVADTERITGATRRADAMHPSELVALNVGIASQIANYNEIQQRYTQRGQMFPMQLAQARLELAQAQGNVDATTIGRQQLMQQQAQIQAALQADPNNPNLIMQANEIQDRLFNSEITSVEDRNRRIEETERIRAQSRHIAAEAARLEIGNDAMRSPNYLPESAIQSIMNANRRNVEAEMQRENDRVNRANANRLPGRPAATFSPPWHPESLRPSSGDPVQDAMARLAGGVGADPRPPLTPEQAMEREIQRRNNTDIQEATRLRRQLLESRNQGGNQGGNQPANQGGGNQANQPTVEPQPFNIAQPRNAGEIAMARSINAMMERASNMPEQRRETAMAVIQEYAQLMMRFGTFAAMDQESRQRFEHLRGVIDNILSPEADAPQAPQVPRGPVRPPAPAPRPMQGPFPPPFGF